MASMTKQEVKALQRAMNRFTAMVLKNFPPILDDGDRGPLTNRRISECKLYLGYKGGAERSHRVTALFLRQLDNPEILPPEMKLLAEERRHKQHERAKQEIADSAATFDGRPIAAWMKPYLDFARAHGWTGTLTSGFRDPAHSEELCLHMCGKPSCPGLCAGRTSNHSGRTKPKGAVDVTDFVRFGQLMQICPREPRIFNDLPKDHVHFSATGH